MYQGEENSSSASVPNLCVSCEEEGRKSGKIQERKVQKREKSMETKLRVGEEFNIDGNGPPVNNEHTLTE